MATKKAGTKSPRSKATSKTRAKKKAPAKSTKKSTKKVATKSRAKKASGAVQVEEGLPFGGVRVSREIGGRTLTLETGRMAKQADGAVFATYGETAVLATAQSSKARDDIDFFPLTCDYREKASAAGKFPGGFFKREGRPTTREILTCRIIDRAIRPLFPDGYKQEVQVLAQVMSTDQENESDILAAVASFAAVAISSIPHERTLGACRIGLRNDKLLVNPTWSDLAESDLNLTVAAHEGALVMVEAGANQVAEDVMLEALELGHRVCVEVAELVDELVDCRGKTKAEFSAPAKDHKLEAAILKRFGKDLKKAPFDGENKHEQAASKKAVLALVAEDFPAPADATDREAKQHAKDVDAMAREIMDQAIRDGILKGRRVDGRDSSTIRPISVEVGVLPRCHGSALFTRGETQALCTATLGTRDDEQMLDGIYPEPHKRFLLHYTFPPYSVGEVKRFGFTSRREIGHGALAERSIEAMLPVREDFPYTLRVTSEILESNGSSSMATVCGGTLALMDAGVPLRQPVAGIAMGLVVEGKKVEILSDILGTEDHCGDMDFKVTGTGKGINALQMDIKCDGLTREILENALEQARQGRLHILREMLKVIRSPREKISPNAPRLESVQVPTDKIGMVIGPGGRMVREMQEEYQCRVHIGDTGLIQVAGQVADLVEKCVQRIKDMTAEVEVGTVYTGRVTSIKEFGAFVEILPGQEGLVHVSELSNEFIRAVTDVVRIGDEIQVKVIGIDDFGKIKLSKRALEAGGEGDAPRAERRPRREDEDRPRRPRRDHDEERPRRPRSRDDEDRPRRSRGRDDEDRPRRSRGRDDEDRPRRSHGRDDEDRPRRPRGRDDEDRPRRTHGRDDEERPRRTHGRDDEDRPRRTHGRDDEDRPRRPRGRDDEDRPRRSRGDEDTDRPVRSRRSSRSDEDRGHPPAGGRRSDAEPRAAVDDVAPENVSEDLERPEDLFLDRDDQRDTVPSSSRGRQDRGRGRSRRPRRRD